MKALELIKSLQELVDKHGDCEVETLGSYSYKPVFTPTYNAIEETGKLCAKHANTFII